MPPVVRQLGERPDDIGWVTDLLVAGSLATGDYVPGVSDLDLVALTEGPVDSARQETLASLHRELDRGPLWDWTWAACTWMRAGWPTSKRCTRRGLMARLSSAVFQG